ncbi:acyl-CoA dehydrogenase [Acrocarpospora pleiomorpha]|uniref:Acyl-CoA dehydrogenase n=1 Tax=Acrocarpospora pleiomorpha TaxID=90975 RepID=A0A5M3XT26_9ACTN|nr:acyl-CoA dehydrogenase family protein [Acrocarpospora pleiomorpha]GES21548.1 acyl-CoA dehydrogenase [Acrocarpospora pleiomorpha]
MAVIWEPTLDAEAAHWREVARDLSERVFGPAAEEIDANARYPHEHIPVLVESGLAGLFVPKEFGGAGAPLVTTCAVMEELAHGCATTASLFAAYILGSYPILLAGTDDQKDAYLRAAATKGESVSFGLTERNAGSDASAVATTATPEGDKIRIRGEKWFIGNGGESRFYTVFARSETDAKGRARLTAYVVDKESEGVVIDEWVDKMGIRGTKTSNIKLDTLVDPSARVGEPGRGIQLALGTLTVGRISTAAQCVGIGRAAYDEAASHAVERRTFGSPIIDNQGVSFPLAEIATELSAARMMTYEAARMFDAGQDTSVIGSMAKYYGSTVAHHAVNVGVQTFGGYGYCKPSKVERLYRDQRIFEIVEGTSEIQRLVIGRAIKDEKQGPRG